MSEFLKSIGYIKNSDNVEKKTKSEFVQGHRKKIFNEEQIKKIKHLKNNEKWSNCKIAIYFGVSEKTIRNYLKAEKYERKANKN